MKIKKQPTFADQICDVRVRKIKTTFFGQMNNLLDWEKIQCVIEKHYTKGQNAIGTPAYDGVLLFKLCLLHMVWVE